MPAAATPTMAGLYFSIDKLVNSRTHTGLNINWYQYAC
jgi:hypothetical protein